VSLTSVVPDPLPLRSRMHLWLCSHSPLMYHISITLLQPQYLLSRGEISAIRNKAETRNRQAQRRSGTERGNTRDETKKCETRTGRMRRRQTGKRRRGTEDETEARHWNNMVQCAKTERDQSMRTYSLRRHVRRASGDGAAKQREYDKWLRRSR